MIAPESLRHQQLNALPQQIFSRISKQLLHLRVDQDDLSLLIHHHHCIWSCFQQLSEFAFRHDGLGRRAQILLRQPGFGHIPGHTGEPVWLSGIVIIDFSACGHVSDGSIGPHDAEF